MGKAKITRTVKILDAVLKENDPTDEDGRIKQYIWLQLRDIETEYVYSTNLSLEDIKNIMKAERYLEGRELVNFCVALKSREDALTLVFDPNEEITVSDISNEEAENE
jgi:hypothetical protein